MKIKVCGITNNRNLKDIAMLAPDYMGFIFHEDSPRDVSGIIDRLDLSTIPSGIKKVAVTVDQPFEKVKDIITKYKFDAIQLHGDESPSYCKKLMSVCHVIKAFRVSAVLPKEMAAYEDNCHLFLLDAKGRYPGGNGIKFNHDILKEYHLTTPYILSGGIGDNDLPYLQDMDMPGLAGVDLNSRFELSPGYKSISSLKVFIQKLRTHATINR